MLQQLGDAWANPLYRRLILTGLVLLVSSLLRRLIHRAVIRALPEDSPHIFRIRRASGYLLALATSVVIFAVWVQSLGDLSVAFGILAAGLALALQEVIGSIAGWLTIVSGKPFTIGDRIETGGIRGDVIDVSILRTKLMEIGNWLGGDHNTGRIVTVSNAFIFKEPLFNYSRYLNYVWDEIIVPVTYETDWQQAIPIMTAAATEHRLYQELQPKAEAQRRQARRELAIKITPLEPRVYVRLTDNWIEMGLVYPVGTDVRRSFRSEVSQEILTKFAQAHITVASQTITIVQYPHPTPAQAVSDGMAHIS